MPINEQIAAAVKILTYGLEMPDPRQGSFVICNFFIIIIIIASCFFKQRESCSSSI
jgi:hypothetical protein